jgi:hypothetical protein
MKKSKSTKNKKTAQTRKKRTRKNIDFLSMEDHDESIGIMNHRFCYKKGKRVPCDVISSSPFNLYFHKL